VIGRCLGQHQPEKLAQRKRVRRTPTQWPARRPSLRSSRSAATGSSGPAGGLVGPRPRRTVRTGPRRIGRSRAGRA
jgi:hypothetical protein